MFTSEIEKVATKRLSRNISEWSKQCIEYFYDQFPQAMGQPINIVFKQKDPQNGYGIGAVRLGPFTIPVVIKNFVAFPNDLAIRQDGVMIPLNTEVIGLYMANTSPFQHLKQDPNDLRNLSIIDRALTYASAVPTDTGVKTSSVLEKLAEKGCITFIGKKAISKFIKSDKDIELNYQNNDNALNVLCKLAKLEGSDVGDVVGTLRKVADRDLQYLYKSGASEYTMIVGSSKIDDPVFVKLSEGRKSKFDTIKTAEMPLVENIYPNLDKEGQLLPLKSGGALFITKEGNYCKLDGNHKCNGNFDNNQPPNPKDYGLFAVKLVDGEYLGISEPFTVVKVASTSSSLFIEGHSKLKKCAFEVIRPKGNDLHQGIEEDSFYVPGNAVFVKLGNEINKDKVIKLVDNNAVMALSGGFYAWKGDTLNKYASDHNLAQAEYDKTYTIWALIQCGASKEDIEKVSSLQVGKEYSICRRLRNTPLISKISEGIEEEYNPGIYNCDYWTKLAAYMPSESSVDAVLSLNFLNKNTINKYIEQIPLFEEVAHQLSSLIFAVRLGLKDMDEAPIVEANQAISKVLFMLYGSKNIKQMKK